MRCGTLDEGFPSLLFLLFLRTRNGISEPIGVCWRHHTKQTAHSSEKNKMVGLKGVIAALSPHGLVEIGAMQRYYWLIMMLREC